MSLYKGSVADAGQIASTAFGPTFECPSCASGVQEAWNKNQTWAALGERLDSHVDNCPNPLSHLTDLWKINDMTDAASLALTEKVRHAATTHANAEGPCDTTEEVPRLLCPPM